jgi:hypothetical protein
MMKDDVFFSFGISFFPIPEFPRNFRKFYRLYVRSHTVGRVHHIDGLLRIVFGNIFSKNDRSMKEIEDKVYQFLCYIASRVNLQRKALFFCLCAGMEKREGQKTLKDKDNSKLRPSFEFQVRGARAGV